MKKIGDFIKQNWIIFLIGFLALISVVCSLVIPKIIISYILEEKPELDFSQAGAMGSAISGIMIFFATLAGVLVTFLAFYIQFRANREQIEQFDKTLNNEKQKMVSEEKRIAYNHLKMLSVDLTNIISDVQNKAERIKEYVDLEKQPNLKSNILNHTSVRKYGKILEIEKLQIYKGFHFYLSKNENWVEDYNRLYEILYFFPELWSEIYGKYERHIQDLFQHKSLLSENIHNLMNKISKIIFDSQVTYQSHIKIPYINAFNKCIRNYYDIISQSLDENGNPISETDFNQINENVLNVLLQDLMFIIDIDRENVSPYEQNDLRTIEEIIQQISDMRKKMQSLKNKKHQFAMSLEKEYKKLVDGNEQDISAIDELSQIKQNIDKEISVIKYEEI